LTILTDARNLDEITFSGGSQADYPGTYTTDWTDGDTGAGESTTGVIFDGKSTFKFNAVAAAGGNAAIRSRDVGTFATPEWISINAYFDTLGTLTNADYFEARFDDSAYRLWIRFASDGIFIYDGAAWNEVGVNLVVQDVWQEWTFVWTVAAAGVVDVYLNGTLQASAVDCSYSIAGTDGTTTFTQLGATVVGLTYLDFIKIGVAQRFAGETWLPQEGGELTIRTDTRWYDRSPASMTGSLGNITITEGKVIFDGTDVRWLAFSGGGGNVPAVKTSITQGGVTGILLAVYGDPAAVVNPLLRAPEAPGGGMPATGFLKFLSVTGGAFAAGALTGITANATGADVAGWIEIVCDSSATITVPRLGEHEIRGDWFYLADADGTVAQVIQVPTNGGGATTYCPGIWIETTPGSNTYEYWPALNGATNGWAVGHIGGPFGATDARCKFVKDIGTGQIQIGEAYSQAATYAHVAAQATTYVGIAHSCTYEVVSNVCIVTYPTGHLLQTGHIVGIDFTSGGAAALDANFTVTVLDAYRYSFALVTADTTGNCTSRPGLTMSFAAHSLGVGDVIYCDFTSGGGADGDYEIYAVTGTGTYLIKYPTTSAVSSGNVSTYSRYEITLAAHGLAVGNRVYLDFTSGAGVDGIYTIVEVPGSGTFRIVANNNAAGDGGNVTVKMTIGHIPENHCKTRIPNVFLREAATGSRATNRVDAAAGTRPEWATTTAGAIDFEYAYSTWYHNFAQAYSVKHLNVATYDTIIISECATALDLKEFHASMYGALDAVTLTLTSNFAGGTIEDCKFQRGNTPGTSDHAIYGTYNIGQIFDNVVTGIIQLARSSGYPMAFAYGGDLTFNGCKVINGTLSLAAVNTVEINDLDYTDVYMGYGKVVSALYAVTIGAGCVDVTVDGITFGFGGTFANVHPPAGLVNPAASTNTTIRNIGTYDNPLPCGTFRPNAYAMAYAINSSGNNYNLRGQRIYIDDYTRTGLLLTINSDKLVLWEHIYGGRYTYSAMAIFLQLDNGLNSVMRNVKTGANSVTGGSSIYGSHFVDYFIGNTMGRYVLPMNEPTSETTTYFTMVSGTRKFNSSGGIILGVVGNQAIWEDAYYRLGHSGFQNTTPTMSGGTIGNYTVEYDIDVNDGNGFSNSWTVASGANLSGETINPALGFKLKIRITTTTANLDPITFLRIDTISTSDYQENNLYPLDVVTVNIVVVDSDLIPVQNARVYVAKSSDGTQIINALTDASGEASGTMTYLASTPVTIRIRKSSAATKYLPIDTVGTVGSSGLDQTIVVTPDGVIA
jgi:hypothetical protein